MSDVSELLRQFDDHMSAYVVVLPNAGKVQLFLSAADMLAAFDEDSDSYVLCVSNRSPDQVFRVTSKGMDAAFWISLENA